MIELAFVFFFWQEQGQAFFIIHSLFFVWGSNSGLAIDTQMALFRSFTSISSSFFSCYILVALMVLTLSSVFGLVSIYTMVSYSNEVSRMH